MLQPKLEVAVDYEKCHPEKCHKVVRAAVLECLARLWKQEEPYGLPYHVPGFSQECGLIYRETQRKEV
jgi:hypothetical protein